jgi:hypothetical protein
MRGMGNTVELDGFLLSAISEFRARSSRESPEVDAVLRRLQNDPRAGKAIAAITDDVAVAASIVLCCVEAVELCSNFFRIIQTESALLARVSKLQQSVVDLSQFVTDLETPTVAAIEARVSLYPGEGDGLRYALQSIRRLIESRARVAAETPGRLGATRKTKTALAGETAALGWLGEGVERRTGLPHRAHVATLGEISLGLSKRLEDEVTEDRVKAARKTRKREWRAP